MTALHTAVVEGNTSKDGFWPGADLYQAKSSIRNRPADICDWRHKGIDDSVLAVMQFKYSSTVFRYVERKVQQRLVEGV